MRPDQFLGQYAAENILKTLDEMIVGQEHAKRPGVGGLVEYVSLRPGGRRAGCHPFAGEDERFACGA